MQRGVKIYSYVKSMKNYLFLTGALKTWSGEIPDPVDFSTIALEI